MSSEGVSDSGLDSMSSNDEGDGTYGPENHTTNDDRLAKELRDLEVRTLLAIGDTSTTASLHLSE